jgi:hypothetical protein
MAASVESIMSVSTSQEHQAVDKMTMMTNQPLPALLGHLSNNVHHQTMKEMSMQDEPHLNFDTLPWNEPKDADIDMSAILSPALQKTHSLLENFSRVVKKARSSLLNCDRPIPQFPQAEWLNLLSGNAVDLDHVFSNIYTVSHNSNNIIELGKSVELLHGSSTPTKVVKTHGDWVIAWDCLVDATLFMFKHRRSELQSYGKHIQQLFASLPSQFHGRAINYDRAICIRAAQ